MLRLHCSIVLLWFISQNNSSNTNTMGDESQPQKTIQIECKWAEVRLVAGLGSPVEKTLGTFQDLRASPNSFQEWDWNVFGTKHKPGISLADVRDLVNESGGNCKVVILSRGFDGRLECSQDVINWLGSQGIIVYHELTPQAVELFNHFQRRNIPVAALIHSTC